MFITEQAAIFPGGSWEIAPFDNMGLDFDLGWFPPPVKKKGDKITYVWNAGLGMGMYKDTPHPEEVKKYLAWMLTPEASTITMNDHGIFLRIIVPLLSPALASVAIINVLPVWNEFWFSLVLIRTNANKTIPLATASLIGQFETQWGAVFAVLTLSALPLMLLYIILSKQFLKGLLEGSLKGG